ncbi:hypothetical protein [Candidatus Endomicrobiellum trichonymphae]|uniref:hypothetical protein n=1 Tax=Endomicrobium trichonymphae TaxID=1408204 RepID=UPI000865487C|nr:hypothetical protein [Candidatus Endomicrobium trichonymphae]BAV59313.1 hypothetical protein RSTT_P2-008 [Candidatus Endomicrobium trichonymphae]
MEYKKETDYYENDMRHTADAPKLEKRLKKSLNVFGLVLLVLAVYLFGSFLLCSCYRRSVVADNNAVLPDAVTGLKSDKKLINGAELSLIERSVVAERFRFGAIAPVIVDVAAVDIAAVLLQIFLPII